MTTAYVFPGQGSQFVGMGAELARMRPIFRGHFDRADAALGFPLSALCWTGPEAELADTVNTQPAIFTHSIAAFAMAEMSGELAAPAFMAGHSLGEFSALCAAGALAFEDGVRLVRTRGELMKAAGEKAPGAMAAVLNVETAVIEEVCAEVSARISPGVVPANDNCPGQLVISGGREAVAAAVAALKARGARRVVPLNVSIASHSPLMAEMQGAFARRVAETPITPARVPVIANTTARPITHPDDIRAELTAQLTSPVRWTDSVRAMRAAGVARFIELGPKDVLGNLIKRIDPAAETMAVG
ncbi:MAG: ACP S-malonyltransferase [Thermoflexales bacterium]|nr:ACP S-malonyltransferase [Thermoflexales bacterium]